MENQRISADDLAARLVSSKKIMSKVDKGDFVKGAVNSDILKSSPEELMKEGTSVRQANVPTSVPTNSNVANVTWNTTPEKIKNSKLPDAIKKAMMENPIQQIALTDSLDMDLVKKAKRLMDMETSGKSIPPSKAHVREPEPRTITEELQIPTDYNSIVPIIENIVRKTINEVLDKKLDQLLMAQNATTINENLAIKVGDTIFSGKITKSKQAK